MATPGRPRLGHEYLKIYLPRALADAVRHRADELGQTLSVFVTRAILSAHPDLKEAVSERRRDEEES